jgi:hypothetical protein
MVPSPEPRLAPVIAANRTPSPSPSVAETFPSEPPSLRPIKFTTYQLFTNTTFNADITRCFIDRSSCTTTATPLPSETGREQKQLPRAKRETQHFLTSPAPGILVTRPGSVQVVSAPVDFIHDRGVFLGLTMTSLEAPLPKVQDRKWLVYFFLSFFFRISETDPSLLVFI